MTPPPAPLCLLCRAAGQPCALHVQLELDSDVQPALDAAPKRRRRAPEKVYRCGKCTVLGHNRRSCTAP